MCPAFLGLVCDALALSSTSPLNGYHFGSTTAGTENVKKVTTSNLRRKQPKGYVPDGLTEEEYRKIKDDERAQQQRMKFDMWGPRFKQVDGDPDSNWFNLPSLWTGGFDANDEKSKDYSSKNGDAENGIRMSPVTHYLRRHAFAYLVLLISSQLLTRSLSAKQATSSRWIALRVIIPLVSLKPMSILASFAGRRRMVWLNTNGTTKLASIIAALMTLLAFGLK